MQQKLNIWSEMNFSLIIHWISNSVFDLYTVRIIERYRTEIQWIFGLRNFLDQ